MENKIDEIVGSLLDGIHTISRSETIVGQPQQAGEATVVPIHRLRVAFGAGGGGAGAKGRKAGGETGGQGAGGAVELDPVAAIAVGKDGRPRLLPVDADIAETWAGLISEVPDLVTKIARNLGQKMADRNEALGIEKLAGDKKKELPTSGEIAGGAEQPGEKPAAEKPAG
ncbi:MAG: hypothetical protein HY744_01800 [Deltaproteobacteria bacterium]|nr:hypothetical protein [Deltaproteobacteria bacterium]